MSHHKMIDSSEEMDERESVDDFKCGKCHITKRQILRRVGMKAGVPMMSAFW